MMSVHSVVAGMSVSNPVMAELREAPYLPGFSLGEYVQLMQRRHPAIAALLSFQRPGTLEALSVLAAARNEFETDERGRGDSYRRAQVDPGVRSHGIMRLLELVAGDTPMAELPPGFTVLDVLGGDGVVARLVERQHPSRKARRVVLTGDIAAKMVNQAISYGLPAVRQSATFLFLRERSLDGVMIAYGTHHLTAAERLAACCEAHRALRSGGRLVLHDFEAGSPVATWFHDVVDRFTDAGHAYEHFTRASVRYYLSQAGFSEVTVRNVYDPFVVHGVSEDDALGRLLDYVLDMYGLRAELDRTRLWEMLDAIFRYPDETEGLPQGRRRLRVWREGPRWLAELPRVAIVGTGRREEE
jgi:ubiquinone/menaquinone biosynthesis C-methylase UbiE